MRPCGPYPACCWAHAAKRRKGSSRNTGGRQRRSESRIIRFCSVVPQNLEKYALAALKPGKLFWVGLPGTLGDAAALPRKQPSMAVLREADRGRSRPITSGYSAARESSAGESLGRLFAGHCRRAATKKMVAGSRIAPERASAANAASISRAITWRVGSAGLFSSISLAVGPIVTACRASSSGVPQMIVGWARSTENPADVVRVAEGQRAGLLGGPWRRRPQMSHRNVVGNQPVPVLRERRPARKNEPSAGLQRAGDVAERRRRVGEEHNPHARGREVEGGRLECEHLRVAIMQSDVAQPVLSNSLPRGPEHRLGNIDRDDAAMLADRRGERLGQRPGAAADFEHTLAV